MSGSSESLLSLVNDVQDYVRLEAVNSNSSSGEAKVADVIDDLEAITAQSRPKGYGVVATRSR